MAGSAADHSILTFGPDYILVQTWGNQVKTSNARVREVVETQQAWYIMLSADHAITIIPKTTPLDHELLTSQLHELAEAAGVNYHMDLNWAWK